MDECGEAISYHYAGLEKYTYRCILRPGHKGCHYHQTTAGGLAWHFPHHLMPRS